MHRAGGLGSVAQIAKDLGARVDLRKLATAAAHYEGAAVRRLGYLLDQASHSKQARTLQVYADSEALLDNDSLTPCRAGLSDSRNCDVGSRPTQPARSSLSSRARARLALPRAARVSKRTRAS